MKKTLHLLWILAVAGITHANAQLSPGYPLALTEDLPPGYGLLSEITDDVTASRILEEKEDAGLEIKASRMTVDLKSEKTVEFSARSSWAKSFVWKFGDGSTMSGFQHVNHAFEKPGTYKVTVIASNEKETAKETIEVTVVDRSEPLKLEEMKHYIVFPYDNKLEAAIQLDLPRREKHLFMEVQDVEGNRLYEIEIGKVKKRQLIHVDLQNLDSGKYYAVLKGRKYSLVSRLTVAR